MIHKMCQECAKLNNGCKGKEAEQVVSGNKPCKKYEFDMGLLNETKEISAEEQVLDEVSEPVETVEESIVETQPEPVSEPIEPDEEEETKAEKFTRIYPKRLDKAVNAIRVIGNLGSYYDQKKTGTRIYTYDWTDEQKNEIISTLRNAINDLENKFERK